MRALILVLLFALPWPSLAINICPTGTIADETVVNISTPGQHFTATDCTLNGYVLLTTQHTPSNNDTMRVTIENSIVNGLIDILLFTSARALTVGPLYITIQDNVFNNHAAFYVARHLPPNSWLTFQNNRMTGFMEWFSLDFITLVYVNSFLFFPNTSINIAGNTITYNAPLYETAVRLIYVHILFDDTHNNGTLNILNNTISANNAGDGALIYLNSWSMQPNSTLQVDFNKLTVTNGQNPVIPLYLSYIYGDATCLVSYRHNEVNVASANVSQGSIINLYDFEGANLRIHYNVIASNYEHFIRSDWYFYLPASASIMGNVYQSTATSINRPIFYVYRYYFLPNSSIDIVSNTFTAPSVSTANMLFLQILEAHTEPSAAIVYCGNLLPWADACASVENLFPSTVLQLVTNDSELCPSLGTCSPPTTTPVVSASTFTSTSFAASVWLMIMALVTLL